MYSLILSLAAAAVVSSEGTRQEELAVSMEHSFGLATEHAHGQAMWPLDDGDEPLIRQALALLPADGSWTWEPEDPEENGSYTWGMLRMTHVEDARHALVLHMLHRHGLAPLLASSAGEAWAAHSGGFVPEDADEAGLDAVAATRQLKLLVLAELAFPPIAALRAVLEQISLNGLRNMHSYDHSGHWRCMPSHMAGGGDVTQVSANAAVKQWMVDAQPEAADCGEVNQEFFGLLDTVVSEAWNTGGQSSAPAMHNQFFTVGSGRSAQSWGALAPTAEWITADDDIRQVTFDMYDGKCEVGGMIFWNARLRGTAMAGTDGMYRSAYMIPMYDEGDGLTADVQRAKCASLKEQYTSGDRAAAVATASARVRAYVDGAVLRHRALMTANRAAAFAHEECDLRNAPLIPEVPRVPSACNGVALAQSLAQASSKVRVVRSTGIE